MNRLSPNPILSPTEKSVLLAYAEQVLESQHCMQTTDGKNIIHYTLQGEDTHTRMQHYPKGDRIDHATGAQYFYHCHREDEHTEEHGHFHCFLRYPQIPETILPKPLADWEKFLDNPMTHLISISMNRYGQPIRLFTVNRWVTDEICYEAKYIPTFLAQYKMTKTDDPYWITLDRWVEGMLQLFTPQIIFLNHERDRIMNAHALTCDTPETPYNDENLEEISSLSIDLKTHIQWLLETV